MPPVAACPVVTPFQAKRVGLRIGGGLAHQRRAGARQLDAQAFRGASRNLVLHREHVVQVAVVALGPQFEAVGHVGEVGGDANAVAGLAHAAFHDVLHVQALADLGELETFLLAVYRRRA